MIPLLTQQGMIQYWSEMVCGYVRRRHLNKLWRENARASIAKLRKLKEEAKASIPVAPIATVAVTGPAPAPTPSPDCSKRFECPAGLATLGDARAIFIRSPRTGRTAIVPAHLYPHLPPRLPGRIAQAAARGVRTIPFTREELLIVARVFERLEAGLPAGRAPGGESSQL